MKSFYVIENSGNVGETMEKEIPLSLIDLPDFDLRFYRDQDFFQLFCKDIEKSGIHVKPIVRKHNNRYEVIDGVNRIKCVKKLKWETVICDVQDIPDETESLIMGLKLNLFRNPHDRMGVCNVCSRLHELGMKQIEIAKRFRFSKGYISKLVKISKKLDPYHKLELAKGRINIAQAYTYVKTTRNPDLMAKLERNGKIEFKCDVCNSSVPFHGRELVQLCHECKRKLQALIRKEQEKYDPDKSQERL